MNTIQRYLFWVKELYLGTDCLPLQNYDYFYATFFGTIGLPLTLVLYLLNIKVR